MRAIRVELLHQRERVPLVIRARFERTFFGVGSFAGVVLLLGGLYLLRAAFQDPFGAADVRVLVAGFALALASFLLVYLVWPRGKMALARRERRFHALEKWDGPVLNVYGEGAQNPVAEEEALHLRKELPGPV
jgi:hypothetical protein